jgi:hypothetical protein
MAGSSGDHFGRLLRVAGLGAEEPWWTRDDRYVGTPRASVDGRLPEATNDRFVDAKREKSGPAIGGDVPLAVEPWPVTAPV